MDARQYASLPDPFPMWRGGVLLAVPHIGYSTSGLAARFAFEPPQPVAGAAFLP